MAAPTAHGSGHDHKLDATLLRKALRLVHCLQRERGVSCAHSASDGEHKAVDLLLSVRRNTDVALKLFLQLEGTVTNVRTTLFKIRSSLELDSSHDDDKPTNNRNFHRIMLCYKTLIESIVHDYILKSLTAAIASIRGKKHHGHNRSKSVGAVVGTSPMFRNIARRTANTESSRRSNRDLHRKTPSDLDWDKVVTNLSDLDLALVPPPPPPGIPPPEELDCTDDRSGSRNRRMTSPRMVSFQQNIIKHDEKSGLVSLLNLLGCFVQLKERTGVERATMSGFMAVHHAESFLLNDLILEVEHQHKLIDQLKQWLPELTGLSSLRNLIEELVVMSPALRELQNKILADADFNLKEIEEQYDSTTKVFDLLSVYIDRLHALELLVLDELECSSVVVDLDAMSNDCRRDSCIATAQAHNKAQVLQEVFGETNLQNIKDSKPEKVKEQLLLWAEDSRNDVHGSSPSREQGSSKSNKSGRKIAEPPVIEKEASSLEAMFQLMNEKPPADGWEIDLYEIKFRRRLGRGSEGTTYLAEWSGESVAVKVASISEMGLEGWRTEVQSLQKLHHPNIIRLLGTVYHQSPLTLCLVLEYCSSGDLASAMQKPTPRNFFVHVGSSIAKGMAYLHNRGVLHRDIKPSNVLLDGNVSSGDFRVKVTDFGMATEAQQTAVEKTAEAGTYRYMAPEVIRHEAYSLKADIFSFAVLLWELITREPPFARLSQIEAAGKVAIEKARPPFPSKGMPSVVRELIETCWSDDPSNRLPFDEIVEIFSTLMSKLSSEEQRWLEGPMGHQVYDESGEEEEEEDEKEVPNVVRQAIGNKPTRPKGRSLRHFFHRKSSW